MNLDEFFKFKIGDKLLARGTAYEQEKEFAMSDMSYVLRTMPTAFIVIERILQECPGGTQRKYGGYFVRHDGTIAETHALNEELFDHYPKIPPKEH